MVLGGKAFNWCRRRTLIYVVLFSKPFTAVAEYIMTNEQNKPQTVLQLQKVVVLRSVQRNNIYNTVYTAIGGRPSQWLLTIVMFKSSVALKYYIKYNVTFTNLPTHLECSLKWMVEGSESLVSGVLILLLDQITWNKSKYLEVMCCEAINHMERSMRFIACIQHIFPCSHLSWSPTMRKDLPSGTVAMKKLWFSK